VQTLYLLGVCTSKLQAPVALGSGRAPRTSQVVREALSVGARLLRLLLAASPAFSRSRDGTGVTATTIGTNATGGGTGLRWTAASLDDVVALLLVFGRCDC
jgi:hypothetical protein